MYLKYIEETQKGTANCLLSKISKSSISFSFIQSSKLKRRHVMSSWALNNLRTLFSSVND